MEFKNRKETRFIANFDGFYRLENTYEWLECYIYDISESGTLLKIKQPLFKDDRVEICLNTDDTDDIITGTVVNTKGQIVGIELTTKNASDIIKSSIDRAFAGARSAKKKSGF
ncbi:MAG: PilZ domain-containing protein [Spirochaetaceae bacterium]